MGMLYGAILGLTYDVVYTEILGIYMFLLPFLAYLISKSMKILQNNILIACLTALLFTAVFRGCHLSDEYHPDHLQIWDLVNLRNGD
ncbi:rod shape-determining protein MreD [Peribacillus frigoritolerans]|nr:rod shape-determining protein MreD [Peribacillus frigoritolerans]